MLVEHVSGCAHTYEHGARVAIIEHVHRVVEGAPACDHIEFITVVLDMSDAARRMG